MTRRKKESVAKDELKDIRARIRKNNKAAEHHSTDASSEDRREDSDVADSEQVARKLAKEVASLKIKLAKERRLNGRDRPDDRTRDQRGKSTKSKSKKKVATKMAFKRVDQCAF